MLFEHNPQGVRMFVSLYSWESWRSLLRATFSHHATVELYNLAKDLGETCDLAEVEQKRRDSLLRKLAAWRQTVGAEQMAPSLDFKSE